MNDGLWRGGQPDEEGLRELRRLGIKTVICLRFRTSVIDWERTECEKVGLNFISMPLNYTTLPRAPHIERFFGIVDDASNHPVYVHCFHGSDRTGLLCGIFRIARDGWNVKDAYDEMKLCGFHRFRIRPFKWWLWRYYEHHLSEKKKLQLASEITSIDDEPLLPPLPNQSPTV
ncbi:MAG: dual specificity protein phosphatase family protein [Candidatus Melainabacteria bacterium]|nr:dual specificity protein phosphatase family protein [Candidatus Melainabacteria bacterium]